MSHIVLRCDPVCLDLELVPSLNDVVGLPPVNTFRCMRCGTIHPANDVANMLQNADSFWDSIDASGAREIHLHPEDARELGIDVAALDAEVGIDVWSNEDGTVFADGHVDPVLFCRAVQAFWSYTEGAEHGHEALDPEDVEHIYWTPPEGLTWDDDLTDVPGEWSTQPTERSRPFTRCLADG